MRYLIATAVIALRTFEDYASDTSSTGKLRIAAICIIIIFSGLCMFYDLLISTTKRKGRKRKAKNRNAEQEQEISSEVSINQDETETQTQTESSPQPQQESTP